MQFDVVTLFPGIFQALDYGITGRSLSSQVALRCWNIRDYALGSYGKVDDHSYGGGPGMVLMAEPLLQALKAAQDSSAEPSYTIYLTPQGKPFNQQALELLLKKKRIILVAGRYEGIDERVVDLAIDEEYSIGDYVLSGGEFAALVVIDAIIRLLPGALGTDESAVQDSFVDGLLDYPHYTRPEVVMGVPVPSVLLSGNHAAIARWRRKQALGRTWQRRPELLAKIELTATDTILLNEFIKESGD